MDLLQATTMALLSSNEAKKQVEGLMQLRQLAATNGVAMQALAPFLIRRFIEPRIVGDTQSATVASQHAAGRGQVQTAEAHHHLQKRIVYTLTRGLNLTGELWVRLTNCIDRDVQLAMKAASQAGDDSGRRGGSAVHWNLIELGVTVLRTLASFPASHLIDYFRSRMDTTIALLNDSPCIALRVAAINCLTALSKGGTEAGAVEDTASEREEAGLRPAGGNESSSDLASFRDNDGVAPPGAGHRAAFVVRMVHRSRFAEQLRRLLVDSSPEVVCAAWRLVAAMTGTLQPGSIGPCPPLPDWFCSALGLDDAGRQECLSRAVQLPPTAAQAVIAPLTALCLSSRGAASRLFLGLADRVLYPQLHGSWNPALLASVSAALLSAVTHSPATLLSVSPLIALCCARITALICGEVGSVDSRDPSTTSVHQLLLQMLEPLLSLAGSRERRVHVEALCLSVIRRRDPQSDEGAELRDPNRRSVMELIVRQCTAEIRDGRLRRPLSAMTTAVSMDDLGGGVSDDDAEASPPVPKAAAADPQGGTSQTLARIVRRLQAALMDSAHTNLGFSGCLPRHDSAAAELAGLLFAAVRTDIEKAVKAGAALAPGASNASAAASAASATLCRSLVDRQLRAVLSALDNVVSPFLANTSGCMFEWTAPGDKLQKLAAIHADLLAALTAAARIVDRVLSPMDAVQWTPEGRAVAKGDTSNLVVSALLEQLDAAATAAECLLPHAFAFMTTSAPPIPLSECPADATCRWLLTLFSSVRCVATVRSATGVAPSPLLLDAAQSHAGMLLASACASLIIAVRDAKSEGAPVLPPVSTDIQAQTLMASADVVLMLCDGDDTRALQGKAENKPPTESRTGFREVLRDIADYHRQLCASNGGVGTVPAALAGSKRAVLAALAILGLTLTADGATVEGPPRGWLSALPHVLARPLWTGVPSTALGPRPPLRRALPVRSHVLTGVGDPVHVTLAYCAVNYREVEVLISVVNRTPLCLSQVAVDLGAVSEAGGPQLCYIGVRMGGGPLGFATSDTQSPAATSQITNNGLGRWSISALAPNSAVSMVGRFYVVLPTVGNAFVQRVAPLPASQEDEAIGAHGTASLGGFHARVSVAVNPYGEVDTANDANRARNRDADALLAYVRQKKAAKKNAAGSAANAVSTAAGVAAQARATHGIALHGLEVLPLCLADLLAAPPAIGCHGVRNVVRWLRGTVGVGTAAATLHVRPVLDLADGRGDLDPTAWSGTPLTCDGTDLFIVTECRGNEDDLNGGEHDQLSAPPGMFFSALAVAWLGAAPGTFPWVSFEVYDTPGIAAPEGGVAVSEDRWLVIVRSAPEVAGLASAIVRHPQWPALGRSLTQYAASEVSLRR